MSEGELERLNAFANGISDFYAAHPEDVPEWWRYPAVTPAMVDAFGRAFLYDWSISEALGDLRRGGVEPEFGTVQRGSNQWAVSPSRTSDGHAILLIDPHLSWWGVSRFWEMRIHAGALEGSGVGLAGSPYIGLGHNGNLAWAMTTGGPDTADVYALTLDPDNGNRYRYEDEWREIEQHTVSFSFPDGSSRDVVWEASHHGPIIAREEGVAYAARIAYNSDTNRNRAWEALNFAEDYRGAVAACETLSMFPQNVMVADTSGNIYYQRTGRVPVRDLAYDWSKPVDGSTAATEWQGFHPSSDHLQVLNPEAGYLQNCNIPPDAMIPDSPFAVDAQPHYLFSSAAYGSELDGWTNQRGARAIELLGQDSDVTVADALAYAVDTQAFGFRRWLDVLASSGAPPSDALTELLAWNGQLTKDSTAALKYYYWRKALHEAPQGPAIRELVDDHFAIVEQRAPRAVSLSAERLVAVREAWIAGLEAQRAHFGDTAQPWGRVFRVGRDDESWPVGGGGGDHLGLTTLRSMGYAEADEAHQRHGNRGQTSTQVVVLSKPIRSWIYLPVGQSDRPDSPHYRDQAATVFSERELKPSWWLPEELADHIVSRQELQPRY
jgi:acyl-homoserine lactone acylase PvdQ